jgi:hypothetical protein
MASANLSGVLGALRRYPSDWGRAPEERVSAFKLMAHEHSPDRLLDSLRFFDDVLQSLEQGRKPSSQP